MVRGTHEPERALRHLPLLLMLLAACGSPKIEIGTGEIAFQALEEGGTIEVVKGPQGGYHIVSSVRVAGIAPGDSEDLANPSNPIITFSVDNAGVELAPISRFQQGLEPASTRDGGFTHEMLGRFAVLDIATPEEVVGATVEFTVTVEDASGTVLTDSRTLEVVPNPLNDVNQRPSARVAWAPPPQHNPNLLVSRSELYAIDHGQALPAVQGVRSRMAYPYAGHIAWPVVERMASSMKEHTDLLRALSDKDIDHAVDSVPARWWTSVNRPDFAREALRDRRNLLPDTLDELMERLR